MRRSPSLNSVCRVRLKKEMPKKFGVNDKQQQGRSKKAAQKEEIREKKRKEDELKAEIYWSQGTKDTTKKAEDAERRAQKLAEKKEREEALRQETESLAVAAKHKKENFQVQEIFSVVTEGHEQSLDFLAGSYSADEEISDIPSGDVINSETSTDSPDKHPERRMKAAYRKFEEREMPLLKKEYPYLKLSQLQQLLFKKWKKSPENPFNMSSTQQ